MVAFKVSKRRYYINVIATLSSARSSGRKSVTFLSKICPICTREIAVLPELASTSSFSSAALFKNWRTARSLLLPNGFKYYIFA